MLRQRLRARGAAAGAWRPTTDEAYLEGLVDLTFSNASDDGQQSAAPRVFLARYLPLDGATGTASTQLPNDLAFPYKICYRRSCCCTGSNVLLEVEVPKTLYQA